MAPRLSIWSSPFSKCVCRSLSLVVLAAVTGCLTYAKEVPLVAIELFDSPSGAGYAQLSDLLINGKSEMRLCGSTQRIDHSSYGKLAKVPLAGATSLERKPNGTLILTRNSEELCVVPSNLKFEKSWGTGPSDVAEHAIVQGKILAASPADLNSIPALKPGVKLVFVSQPDTELAEYLRAERAHTISRWEDFLGRYPKSPHLGSAKASLAAVFVKEGDSAFDSYQKTAKTVSPSYGDLRQAWVRDQQALEMVSTDPAGIKLLKGIQGELATLTERGRAELDSYQQALNSHAAGYKHLAASRELANRVLDIDSQFDAAKKLRSAIATETQAVETALRAAENLSAALRVDEAVKAVSRYRAFENEEPRIAAIVSTAYKYHVDRGKNDEAAQKWQEAIQEYQKAVEIDKTSEATASLSRVTVSYKVASDKATATSALQQSEVFAQEKDFIDAYEILANLPDGPRNDVSVKDEMTALQPEYVKDASASAAKLVEAHRPIRGKVDEIELQKAYAYLQRASALQENEDLKLRLDMLSQTFSDYYLDLARHYLEKPSGSGVGLAWLYLDEAQQYKANRNDVRDERVKSTPVHFLRSKLSIRVVFRDQTARKDSASAGFADQLSDAIATGLETSGLPVKVVRANDSTAVEPNFELVGDVLQHRETLLPKIESLESKYLLTEREVPNEEWNKANREYEAANLELQTVQRELEGAQARGKKKEIAVAAKQVQDAQERVREAHLKLDALPKTVPNDVKKSYTYIKKTYDLSAVTQIGFRIVDSSGATIDTIAPITKEAHIAPIVLENVKPEDTEGVKPMGTPPDETQFVTELDIQARDELIQAVKEKVEGLPSKILEQARQRVKDGDLDGAAEAYILYLNSTPEVDTKDREEAKHFLLEEFNIKGIASSAS